MIFSEAQVPLVGAARALPRRAFLVPRNFPVMPHALAEREIDDPRRSGRSCPPTRTSAPIVWANWRGLPSLIREHEVFLGQDFDGAHGPDLTNRYQAAAGRQAP